MLFTDGEPVRRRGEDPFGDKYKDPEHGERLLANDRTKSLRDKNVAVVGLAAGTEKQLRKFGGEIKKWSSKGKYFEADKSNLQNVLNALIKASCDPNSGKGIVNVDILTDLKSRLIVCLPITTETKSVFSATTDLLCIDEVYRFMKEKTLSCNALMT